MKPWMIGIFLTLNSFPLWSISPAVLEETYYQDAKAQILSGELMSYKALTHFEQKLYVDALWDMMDEGEEKAFAALDSTDEFMYDLNEKLRIGILRLKFKRVKHLKADLLEEVKNALLQSEVNTRLLYLIGTEAKILELKGHTDFIELASKHPDYSVFQIKKEILTKEAIADIFHLAPKTDGRVKIFQFCRTSRLYPCLMVMKDTQNEVVRNDDGSLFTHKALASAASGKPSYQRNGDTPTGVWTLDGVMPYADEPLTFGKFRRIIMNFVPRSPQEMELKKLLPSSSHELNWWRPTVVARDVGRNLFRIHGTGKFNNNPASTFYPFMRTNGCVSQRENKYGEVVYQDQKELLDAILKNQNLENTFENQTLISGILYVVEIDNQNAPVGLADLNQLGIE